MEATRTRVSPAIDCLVTGGTGLVGNNVIRMLADQGRRVRTLVRERSGDRELAGVDVERTVGDVTDPEAVRQAVAGARVVIHSAAMVHVGWRRLADMRRVNVEGTRLVAEAARREGARLVHVSSVNALGLTGNATPANEEIPFGNTIECPYVITKREAEQVVLDEVARGLDAVILNPVFMLGPWDWKPSSGRMSWRWRRGEGCSRPLAPSTSATPATSRPGSSRRWGKGGRDAVTSSAATIFGSSTPGRCLPGCPAAALPGARHRSAWCGSRAAWET